MKFTASDGTVFTDRSEYRKYEFELSYTFRNRTTEKLVKAPGSIGGQPFDLSDLDDCEVMLLDHSEMVQIDKVKLSRVLVAASSESVFVRECSNCSFTIACKQLRTRDCHDCTFYLYSKTEPVIELSDGLTFAPFNAAFDGHREQLRQANLDPKVNQWDRVFDFNDEQKTGEHWSLWTEESEGPLRIWRPLGGDAELAIAPTASSSTGPVDLGGLETFGIATMRAGAAAAAPTLAQGSAPAPTTNKPRKTQVGWNPDPEPQQAPVAPPVEVAKPRKSGVGWNPSAALSDPPPPQQESSTATGPPAPQPQPTKKKSAIGWDPDRAASVGQQQSQEPPPQQVPSLPLGALEQQEEGLSAVGKKGGDGGSSTKLKKKKSLVGWSEERLSEPSSGQDEQQQASSSTTISSKQEDRAVPAPPLPGIVGQPTEAPQAPSEGKSRKPRATLVGWDESRLSSSAVAEPLRAPAPTSSSSSSSVERHVAPARQHQEPEPANIQASAPSSAAPPVEQQAGLGLDVELQALLLYAMQRGVNLRCWFGQGPEEDGEEEEEEEGGMRSPGRPSLHLTRPEFDSKLKGLAQGLAAGMQGEALAALEQATSGPTVARAACLAATGSDGSLVDLEKLLSIVDPQPPPRREPKRSSTRHAHVGRSRSSPAVLRKDQSPTVSRRPLRQGGSPVRPSSAGPALARSQARPSGASSSPPRSRSAATRRPGAEADPGFSTDTPLHSARSNGAAAAARRQHLYQLESAVKERLRGLVVAPDRLHALKVRLGATGTSSPVSLADLSAALESAGMGFRRVEVETLMWSIRSFTDRSTAKGVPLRLMTAEVMAYLTELRLDKSIKFEQWATIRAQQKAARKKAAAEELQKALAGKRFSLEPHELDAFLAHGEEEAGLVPAAVLEAEADGRAYDWVYSEGGGSQHFRSRYQEKKEELLQSERAGRRLSRSLVLKYLDECKHKNFEGTLPLQAWLERRAASWATRRKAFAEWLQNKAARMAEERLKRAQKAEQLLQSVGLSSVKQGEEIIRSFKALVQHAVDAPSPLPSAPSPLDHHQAGAPSPEVVRGSSSGGGPVSPRSVDRCFDLIIKSLKPGGAHHAMARAYTPGSKVQQQKPVTVASTAEHVLDHTHSALAHKQQEAEESFREWSQRKKRLVREARRHQKELEAEKHKLAEERKKKARAAYRRWMKAASRNKYFSSQAQKFQARPGADGAGEESGSSRRPPWVDLLPDGPGSTVA